MRFWKSLPMFSRLRSAVVKMFPYRRHHALYASTSARNVLWAVSSVLYHQGCMPHHNCSTGPLTSPESTNPEGDTMPDFMTKYHAAAKAM
jgi:hypothetical protein